MPTLRGLSKRAFRCGLYEAEDILAKTESVELIQLQPDWRLQLLAERQKRLIYHDVTGRLAFLNPGLRKVRLTREYDLFLAVCQNCWDLLYLNAIEGWKDYCKTSVCWVDEVWAVALSEYKHLLPALARFDHVFVGTLGAVGPLSKAIGKTCHWLPGGVDTPRFTPGSNAPQRVIDVYSIGRRCRGIHDALLRAGGRNDFFYFYDTFAAANSETLDPEQHRELLANTAKRSRYFLVAPPKMDMPQHHGGQVEIGYRYFEGAAAGTVMIGQRPDCAAFQKMFPWPDAVIEVRPDGSDVIEVLADLNSDPTRREAIARRNVEGALLRHDWIYRWREVFQAAGVEPSKLMTTREHRLKELAEEGAYANER
jgi:hypothetical protein